jgi:hypothetical protein
MPGQLLSDLRVDTGRRQIRDEGVTERVKVGDAAFVIGGAEKLRFVPSLQFGRVAVGFVQPSFLRGF